MDDYIFNKYPTLQEGEDFDVLSDIISRGKRDKKLVRLTTSKETAILKYQAEGRVVSEGCSEKIAYELARQLGISAARVEFAEDIHHKLCTLSYVFAERERGIEHADAVSFLRKTDEQTEKDFHTIKNIKKRLDEYSKDLFSKFVTLMFFDIFIGEGDRHEENWGILHYADGHYEFSPMYDTASCLLKEFRNPDTLDNYLSGRKNFEAYARGGKTLIYTDGDAPKRFKSFDLAQYLYCEYRDLSTPIIDKIAALDDNIINSIINAVPSERMGLEHKSLIIKYLIKRKNRLKELIYE